MSRTQKYKGGIKLLNSNGQKWGKTKRILKP